MLVAWSPNGTALLNHHECVLSQVATHPDITLEMVPGQSAGSLTRHDCTHVLAVRGADEGLAELDLGLSQEGRGGQGVEYGVHSRVKREYEDGDPREHLAAKITNFVAKSHCGKHRFTYYLFFFVQVVLFL